MVLHSLFIWFLGWLGNKVSVMVYAVYLFGFGEWVSDKVSAMVYTVYLFGLGDRCNGFAQIIYLILGMSK